MASSKKRRFRNKARAFKYPTLASQIPNITTLAALAMGMTSMRFTLQGAWEYAVLFILIAGILDMLDGRLARLLGSTSRFGAELDSLADIVNFGVAPAFLLYLWCMNQWGNIGWAICVLFTICCGLRLARFNTTNLDPDPPEWAQIFFTGVPVTSGAALSLMPILASIHFGDNRFAKPALVGGYLIMISLLMVSRLPTFSVKKLKISPRAVLPLLICSTLLLTTLLAYPWITVVIFQILYLGSIPLSLKFYRKFSQANAKIEAPSDEAHSSSHS